MSVAIIGFGRFGRALAQLLVEASVPFRAYDPFATIEPAYAEPSLEALASSARTIVIAVPVPQIRAVLDSIAPLVRPSSLVLDVGSVKVKPIAHMDAVFGTRIPWIGTHPLFGPVSLAKAERPLRVVVCPNEKHPTAHHDARSFFERLGCEVVEQTAEGHDRVMAHTHALTFFIAKAMIDAGAGIEVPFSPPSFQAISRTIETVRSDAGHLFTAIHNENPFAAEARGLLLRAMVDIDRALADAKPEIDDRSPRREDLVIPDLGAQSPALREAREHIDSLDREIVELLARRAELAQRAARAKEELGHPVVDTRREALVMQARRAWASSCALDPDGVEEVFQAILRFSRRVQRKGEPS